MNESRLQAMAHLLRRDVLRMTTIAGSGHPTTCMSCAEILSVLFFNEMSYSKRNSKNKDNDEFVLSKGHAAPILYSVLKRAGCIKNQLTTLRKLTSPLEGHPMPRSLDWVKVASGSLGQGLSVGVGMALAAKYQKRSFSTYVLLGDSELAEGSVYEALALASHYKLDNIIGIADVNRLGQRGETMVGHDLKTYRKRFNSFGWKTLTVNGHNISSLLKAFQRAKKSTKPVMIICKTYKGKGVSFLENKEGWHGKALDKEQLKKALDEIPNPNQPRIGIKMPKSKKRISRSSRKVKETKYEKSQTIATRDAYGMALANISKADPYFMALDAETSNSTKSDKVKHVKPKQFTEIFIAEQNMLGIGLGMSVKGMNVYASSFSAFLSRGHDQIRMAALSSASFTVCGSHCGVSIGEDGGSQMGLEDIAMFRGLPNSSVFYPSDAVSAEKLTIQASKQKGITYIRTSRPKTPIIYSNNEKFPVGDFKVLKQSKNDSAVVVGSGITVHEALKAGLALKNVAIVDAFSIKPFNSKKFISFVKKHGSKIVVAEDHRIEGGIGEMITHAVRNENFVVETLAIDGIPHSGTGEQLMMKYKIDSKAIIKIIEGMK